MDEKVASLLANGTWSVGQMPDGVRPIPCVKVVARFGMSDAKLAGVPLTAMSPWMSVCSRIASLLAP